MSRQRSSLNFVPKVVIWGVIVYLIVTRANHRHQQFRQIRQAISAATEAAAPRHAPAPGPARAFNNRLWYGKDTDKDIDPILTRRNFLVVLDGSGSMADSQCSGNLSKIAAAKQAIAAFSNKLKPDDNLGLCAFDSRGVTERSPLSLNRAAFGKALQEVRSDSNTPLGHAVTLGYSLLQKQARHQLGYGEYYLIVVTDGEADRGDDPRDIVNRVVGESPVVISTIGFCIGQGHSLNRPGLTLYHDATNLKELNDGLESVLAESDFSASADMR
ncbi:MAG TPA: VWA domain-containing protein [Verrucomicrobiae bacterium]|jgi:Mg-chelatase subunit ChlD